MIITIPQQCNDNTANLRTKIMDFRGFDSSRILSSRGGILMSIGNSLEMLSPRFFAGIMLVGRLGAVVVVVVVVVVAASAAVVENNTVVITLC